MIKLFENKSLPATSAAAPETKAPTATSQSIREQHQKIRAEEISAEQALQNAKRSLAEAEEAVTGGKERLLTGAITRESYSALVHTAKSAVELVAGLQQELADVRGLLAPVNDLMQRIEREERQFFATEITARYTEARRVLAEALVSAIQANLAVAELEERAAERLPPQEIPAAFAGNCGSLSFLKAGTRAYNWLADLKIQCRDAFPEIAHAVLAPVARDRERLERIERERNAASAKELRKRRENDDIDLHCIQFGVDRNGMPHPDPRFPELPRPRTVAERCA